MIVRAVKGLERLVPLHVAGGPRVEGYALDAGRPWRVPGSDRELIHVHQLYALAEPRYTGRSTVPLLWDSQTLTIVSNESAKIMRALDAVDSPSGAGFTLTPADRSSEIEDLNRGVAQGLSEAVYQAGFAQAQAPYDAAVSEVFARLDELEVRLTSNRYLLGGEITEADLRLFPTLVRFDAVYHVLHRCSRRKLVEYPHIWAYARDLFAWRGVASTVDFAQIRQGAYRNDVTNNPFGVVAIAPDQDWTAPHGRDALGPARVALRSGTRVAVDPTAPDMAVEAH
jgi:putative glutathione S-transferase